MPEDNDTQPYGNETRPHRHYVPAEWAEAGEGGGSPKLGGGYEIDDYGNPILTRGLNRPDQRYIQSSAELQSRREARAVAERPDCVVLADSSTQISIRSKDGNNYDIKLPSYVCDCPDRWRLDRSGNNDVHCKHELMAITAIDQYGSIAAMPKSCEYVAGVLGVSVRIIQQACQMGNIPAAKTRGVWIITGDYDPFVTAFQSRQVDIANWPPDLRALITEWQQGE